MEHVVTIDNGSLLALDRTSLTTASMCATNSRASPEPERTVVPLPEENPETEQLAGALERQGATILIFYLLLLTFGAALSVLGLCIISRIGQFRWTKMAQLKLDRHS